MIPNSNQKITSLKVGPNKRLLKASGKRPYQDRKEVPFQRPPAVYGNPDPENVRDKYISMEIPKKKRK